MNQDPLGIRKQIFGYQAFRAPQDEVIATLVRGGDALVLMPPVVVKSLCYQIPAIARPGTGIVVSPLIALMHGIKWRHQTGGSARRLPEFDVVCRAGFRVEQALKQKSWICSTSPQNA